MEKGPPSFNWNRAPGPAYLKYKKMQNLLKCINSRHFVILVQGLLIDLGPWLEPGGAQRSNSTVIQTQCHRRQMFNQEFFYIFLYGRPPVEINVVVFSQSSPQFETTFAFESVVLLLIHNINVKKNKGRKEKQSWMSKLDHGVPSPHPPSRFRRSCNTLRKILVFFFRVKCQDRVLPIGIISLVLV